MPRDRPPPDAGVGAPVRGRPRPGAVRLGLALALALATTATATASCRGRSSSSDRQAPGTTAASTTAVVPSGFGPPVLRGQISDEAVTESSGLVASRRNPGRLWTHNDSDNPPLLFCVEPDGGSCGRWTVAGASNVDWEDIAAGPGPQPGEHYLYVGDIGDNTESRAEVVVYRVVEPVVAPPSGTPAPGGTTAPATALRLHYPDGPHDAESLMVHPTTGDLYVVTKALGATAVYQAPPEGGALTRVATLGLGPLALVSGGDISPDGQRVALCTLLGGFELAVDPADRAGFASVWSRPAVAVALPGRTQGEGIAYRLDGNALLVTSEGYPSPLFEVAHR
jgi:hypothetical protein